MSELRRITELNKIEKEIEIAELIYRKCMSAAKNGQDKHHESYSYCGFRHSNAQEEFLEVKGVGINYHDHHKGVCDCHPMDCQCRMSGTVVVYSW